MASPATIRKFRVVITVRKKGQSGPFGVRVRKVDALNTLEATHLVRRQAAKEGYDVGVTMEVNCMTFRYNAMVKHPDAKEFAEVRGIITVDTEVDVEPAVIEKLLSEGHEEVGSVYNIREITAG